MSKKAAPVIPHVIPEPPAERPTELKREDLLELRLVISEENRTAQTVQLIQNALNDAKATAEKAAQQRAAITKRIQDEYQITAKDQIDGTTGAITRDVVG